MILKILWFTLVLTSFSFGFYNIADVTKDYYKYEVITNVERVTEPNFTFPAVTICATIPFIRSHYINETLISETIIDQSNYSMENFLIGKKFTSFTNLQLKFLFIIL